MPVFRKYRKYVPKRNRPKRYVKKAIARARSTIFNKRVMKVIKKNTETKQAFHSIASTDFNSGIASAGDALRIVPNIAIGSNDNQRIGDQIHPQSLTIRAIVQMLPQGLGQGDAVRKIAARLMIVTPKAYTSWASAYANATTWQQYLLKKGGIVTNFAGDISDLYAPINTDAITCHYNKVIYFNQSTYGQSTATGLVGFDQSHLVRFVNKTIRFGANRKFKYDNNIDGGLTPANGPAYVMLLGYCFVDGSAPDTLSTRVRLQYDTILNYEDA